MTSLRDRIVGSLLGGAVGDALGAPVEFMSLATIRSQFGPGGIRDYAPAYGHVGAITDDTQMTLFTAEGLLRAYVRANLKGISSITSVVSHAYLRWLRTQGYSAQEMKRPIENPNGWLWQIPELHSQRAPGRTCVSALLQMSAFTDQRTNNDSKGAGGIMRVAPVAMMFADQPQEVDEVFRLAKEAAWITHGHPTGYLSAAAFAVILHSLLVEESIEYGIQCALRCLSHDPDQAETRNALNKALQLARSDMPIELAIRQLGEAWVGEEALAIAIYCYLKAKDFEEGVVIAVNHDGDSDTTGSLVGQLIGARCGVGGIPGRWLEQLELREVITQIAGDLSCHTSWNLDWDSKDYDNAITARYPGG